ncbi:MAG: phosphatidylserine decarboxylase [Acidobacteriota bacterium]|nr:phosphatidylserine decarboxylase [Acidobacteriota bacterium]
MTMFAPADSGRASPRRIPIAREGWPFVLTPLVAAGFALLAGWVWAAVGCGLLAAACAAFFRDPDRRVPTDPALVLAPADGKVTRVERAADGRLKISIFLSVFDVHINRCPVAGKVRRVRYLPGRYLAANFEASSAENERNEVWLETERGEVRVTQIAGVIARRIVCRVQPGDELASGARFGLIRFGSRTDLDLPPEAMPRVRPGDRTRGGLTTVAVWAGGDVA